MRSTSIALMLTIIVLLGDGLVAQTSTSSPGPTAASYSTPSGKYQASAELADSAAPADTEGAEGVNYLYSGPFASFVGGIEWGGYSSQTLATNGFLSASLRSGFIDLTHKSKSPLAAALWTRIRLLSAPQASSNGISF